MSDVHLTDRPRTHAPGRSPALSPHRPFFARGLLLLALSGLWWWLVLLARRQAWPLPWAVTPGLAHGLLFGLGAMPLFMAGFFFTAGPRWLGVPAVAFAVLRRPLSLMTLGWGLVLPALHLSAPLLGLGLLLVALGWGLLWRAAGRLLAASGRGDRLHLRGMRGAWLVGICGLAGIGLALTAGQEGWARKALHGVLWWSVLPVYVLALHRMVPMFAELPRLPAAAGRWALPEQSLLWLGLAGCAWGGIWDMLAPPVLPGWIALARAMLEGAAALLLLYQAWCWRRMMRLPLMAMLLCGGLWWALGLGLSALPALWRLASGETRAAVGAVALAPLHAVFAGGLGSLMMAQVSRVTSAHAGRSLAVDAPILALFSLLQLAVLLRLWAAWSPAAQAWLLPLAALFWTLAVGAWSLRLLAWMRRGRAV